MGIYTLTVVFRVDFDFIIPFRLYLFGNLINFLYICTLKGLFDIKMYIIDGTK